MTRLRLPLVLTGVGLVATAFVALVVVAVSQSGGWAWPDEAAVPNDGAAHVVAVPSDREVLVWTPGGDADDCALTDPEDGAALATRPVRDEGFVRSDPAWDWVAVLAAEPRSDAVAVTCTDRAPAVVAVQARPRLPAAVAGLSGWYLVPLGLAAAGVVAVVSGVVAGRGVRR